MRKRILTKYRKKELEYFCLQYGDYKKELAYINLRLGQGEWDDPTYEEVAYRDKLRSYISAIDSSIEESCPEGVRECMRECVTRGKKCDHMNVPCGRRQFYDFRDEFFITLSRKRQAF